MNIPYFLHYIYDRKYGKAEYAPFKYTSLWRIPFEGLSCQKQSKLPDSTCQDAIDGAVIKIYKLLLIEFPQHPEAESRALLIPFLTLALQRNTGLSVIRVQY